MSAMVDFFRRTEPEPQRESWELLLDDDTHYYVTLSARDMFWVDEWLRDVERNDTNYDDTRDVAHDIRESLAVAQDEMTSTVIPRQTFDHLCQVMSKQRLALRRCWSPSNMRLVTEDMVAVVTDALDAHDALMALLLDHAAS